MFTAFSMMAKAAETSRTKLLFPHRSIFGVSQLHHPCVNIKEKQQYAYPTVLSTHIFEIAWELFDECWNLLKCLRKFDEFSRHFQVAWGWETVGRILWSATLPMVKPIYPDNWGSISRQFNHISCFLHKLQHSKFDISRITRAGIITNTHK